jgi:group I intron endonuclease
MRNAKGKSAIYSSILKYGLSDHRLEILEFCERVKAVILAREQYYINLFKPEYNLLQTAGSPLGYKHTEETRAKMSAAKRGQNNFMYGKTHSEETKAKLRLRKHSEETKAKLSAWTRSEETKNKISVAKLGKTHTEETKAKMKEAKKGNKI